MRMNKASKLYNNPNTLRTYKKKKKLRKKQRRIKLLKECSFGKVEEKISHKFVIKVKVPHSKYQFLITCGSCCCCLLCFLAGRGGGVSFKGKGSTDVAMTSGQGVDGG